MTRRRRGKPTYSTSELFTSEIPALVAELGKSEGELDNFRDFHWLVADWLEANRPPSASA